MKRGLLLITCILLFSISAVSAATLIGGKIYNSDFSATVSGADVLVTCNGSEKNTTSLSDGAYSVTYDDSECEAGNTLTVSANHPSYGAGTQSGVIHDRLVMDWDVAIVNVPLVPEFGLIIGGLTVVSAVFLFFVVRRK